MASPEDAATQLKQALARQKPMGTRYKPETYMVVTRWTEKTRIKYIPNPKTPGSKSYPRYERYSKAKTVGEALELGAYPPDLLWDYERGFYRVVGGPVQEEPIDFHRAQAEGRTLTRTDMIFGRWVFKELCKELGTDEKTLVSEARWSESGICRALRLLADREAAALLEQVDAEGREISTVELLRVLRRWAYFKNPYRVNVMPEGQTWVNSDTVGLNCARDGTVNTTHPTFSYPNVMRVMCRWLRDRQPPELKGQPFPFTSINMNFGYGAQRHRDGNNTGLSMLAAFGEFTGGELRYWPDDSKSLKVEKLAVKDRMTIDISKELLLFDGKRCHEVAPFKGERYSLVWFTCARYWEAGAPALRKLASLGFNVPSEASIKSVERLLRAPGGPKTKEGALRWPSARKEDCIAVVGTKKRQHACIAKAVTVGCKRRRIASLGCRKAKA